MELSFANLVKNVEVNEAAFANEMRTTTPADRCYVILFTPRSGSSLVDDGTIGYPKTWLPGGVHQPSVLT